MLSRTLDAAILKLRTLHKHFLTRFGGRDRNRTKLAVSYFEAAATAQVGYPLMKFIAAREWASLASEHDLASGLDAHTLAMDIISQIAWVGDVITKRHTQLKTIGDFPREAAAFAIKIQKVDLALEWLEQGRSVVWNQLLNLHAPAEKLQKAHPDLAAKFKDRSNNLYNAAVQRPQQTINLSNEEKYSLQEETRLHHRLAEEWEALLKEIRLLENFEDFLLPKKIAALKDAAALGPVVVINIHQSRCDALVLKPGIENVHHIPLDALKYDDVERMQNVLKKDLHSLNLRGRESRGGRPYPIKPKSQVTPLGVILGEMYTKIVSPILQSLGLEKVPTGSEPPRVWWCPTGPLTFLPLHAACQDTRKEGDDTSQYVISSYIPTVNALLEARMTQKQTVKQIFAVGMMRTPKLQPLPNAAKELVEIQKLFGSRSDSGSGSGWTYEEARNEEATEQHVLGWMARSSWVHLACHAVQDMTEPTESGLWLHDGRLSITNIIARPFPNADLVFLSACETATGDESVADEAVHITGGMLGAGYRGVIGTMWSIPDEVAPVVAASVYRNLLAREEPDSGYAAVALHEAMKEVRKMKLGSYEESFHSWAPFVHYGV